MKTRRRRKKPRPLQTSTPPLSLPSCEMTPLVASLSHPVITLLYRSRSTHDARRSRRQSVDQVRRSSVRDRRQSRRRRRSRKDCARRALYDTSCFVCMYGCLFRDCFAPMLTAPKRLPLRHRPFGSGVAYVRSRHVRAFVSRRVSARTLHRRLRSVADPKRRRPERISKTPGSSRRSGIRRAKNDPNTNLRPSKDSSNILSKIAATASTPFAKWESLPSRYKLLFATGIAFVICNMVDSNVPRFVNERCVCEIG